MFITGLILKGLIKLMEVIYNEAEKEYLDDMPYMERLNELQSMYEKGEITDEEYEK